MENQTQHSHSTTSTTAEGIKASLKGFVYSLFGLIPVIGIPFSLAAIAQNFKAEKWMKKEWNPAVGYLRAARWLAPLGFLSTCSFLLLCIVIPGVLHDMSYGSSGGG